MPRGATLFNDFFTEPQTELRMVKGRSEKLNNRRNELLLNRYYFYGKFFDNKLSYTFIIGKVADEFFLSPVTVPQIVEDNLEVLAQIKKSQPALKTFKDKWPHLVWEPKLLV